MTSNPKFAAAAKKSAEALAARLERLGVERVVFAESCTAGLIAALLGQVPGISNWLCGSAVTYRESVKTSWLGVSGQTLEQCSAESLATTSEMATGVLKKTDEATFSAAVTGHLGPAAPPDVDGTVFVVIAKRDGDANNIVSADTYRLTAKSRVDRQHEAASRVIELLLSQLT